jgi:hypothetical protein
VDQTKGRTGGKCEILGVYVSACCEGLLPFALDEVFPACRACGRDTTWHFLEVAPWAAKGAKLNGARKGGGRRGAS